MILCWLYGPSVNIQGCVWGQLLPDCDRDRKRLLLDRLIMSRMRFRIAAGPHRKPTPPGLFLCNLPVPPPHPPTSNTNDIAFLRALNVWPSGARLIGHGPRRLVGSSDRALAPQVTAKPFPSHSQALTSPFCLPCLTRLFAYPVMARTLAITAACCLTQGFGFNHTCSCTIAAPSNIHSPAVS